MPVTVSVGNVFARDYRVERPLSEGGMGALYVVEQLSTGSRRALKLMHPQLVQDARLRQRFEQEARVGARIESDHVVQVIAAGVDGETGYPYLVMELLKGEDLGEALKRRGFFSPQETREIFAQLCHALAAAHAAGIVHRDLKPDNVFLAASNREGAAFIVKVLDFGIAKVMAEAQTHATAALGTPLWMAPEQTTSGDRIGPQTDVWALGLIAFRMLTGVFYWKSGNAEDGSTATLIREILVDPVVAASVRAGELRVGARVPPGFDAWFGRCVARDPAGRFADAGEARAALLPLLGGGQAPVPVAPTQHGEPLIAAPAYSPPMTTPVDLTAAATQPGSPSFTPAPMTVPHVPSFTAVPATISEARPFTPAPAPAPQVARKKASRVPLFAAGGGVLLLAAVGILGSRIVSANRARACEASVAGAVEAADVAEACERACGSHPASCAIHGELVQRFSLGKTPVETARASYQKGCDGGDQPACRRLAGFFERSEPARATALLGTACDKGDPGACTLLGVHCEEGRGIARDGARALSLYDKACQASDKLGCAYQAFMLHEGLGVPQDEARAADLARAAVPGLSLECDPGHPKECIALAAMLATGQAGGSPQTPDAGGGKDEPRAAELTQKACDAGEPAGCANMGVMTLLGVGVPRDPEKAVATLQKACDDGEMPACTSLGLLKAGEPYVVRRGPRGVATLKLACHGVFQVGCSGWGAAYPPSPEIAPDPAAAVALSTRACDGGDLTACVNLGAFHQYAAGTPKSREKASELFKKACDGANGGGCGELGSMYQVGRGVPLDGKRAMELLTQACTYGEKDSCISVGELSATGVGAPRSPEAAAAVYRTYCEQHHVAMACNAYGNALVRGFGVPKDVPAGLAFLQSACEGKLDRPYPNACVSLGSIQETGAAGPKDPTAAAKLYQVACDQGATSGCTALARLLADGTGVPRDVAKALALADAGCKASDAGSCDLLGYFHATGKAGLPASGPKGIEYLKLACDDALWGSCFSIGTIHLLGIGGAPKDRAAAAKYLQMACGHGIDDACQKLKQNGL
jgi:TPR repeat protein/serine/threonine protein kinase